MALILTISPSLAKAPRVPALILLQVAVFLLPALLIARQGDMQPVRQLFRLQPLSPANLLKSLFLGLLAWGTAWILGVLTEMLVTAVGGKLPDPYRWLSEVPYWQALLALAVLPALCEEFAFRGYLQWNLRPLGNAAAILLTGILFGVMHLSLVRIIPLAVLGFLFSMAVERASSLVPGIIMHFTNNAVSLSLFFLSKRRPDLALEESPAPTFWTILLLLFGLFLLWELARRTIHSLGPAAQPAQPPLGWSPQTAGKRYLKLLLPLLPTLALYAWAAAREVSELFQTP